LVAEDDDELRLRDARPTKIPSDRPPKIVSRLPDDFSLCAGIDDAFR